MKNYSLVQATEADFDKLLSLRLMTMPAHLEKAGLFLSVDQHNARVSEDYSCSFIIYCEHQMVGMLKYRNLDHCINIMQLQIFPAFQNKGIGRGVLTQLIEINKGKRVELTVLKDNPAKDLYLRLGFTVIGEDDYEYFMGLN